MSAPKSPTAGLQTVPLVRIVEQEGFNPREDYGQEDGTFAELVASIRESGVLVPPIVRADRELFVILAGHRRVRASREAGLVEIPCMVREATDTTESLVLALVENLQRKDLSAIEKAKGFARLKEMGLTNEAIGQRLGCSSALVMRSLNLLMLPAQAQKALEEKQLPVGVAHELVSGVRNGVSAAKTNAIARAAIKDNLPTYEVREKVYEARGVAPVTRPYNPEPVPVRPTTITVSIDLSLKADVDWAIQRYGSVGGALVVMRRMCEKPAAPDVLDGTLTGTWSDPMNLVRMAQAKRWSEILIGLNQSTGGMVALERGAASPGVRPSGYDPADGARAYPHDRSGQGTHGGRANQGRHRGTTEGRAMSAPTCEATKLHFPGTRVPVTQQVASALESLTSHVAAGGNPAQWVRENIAFGGASVQTSTGAVTVCPTCGLVLMGEECDSCEGAAPELCEGAA